MALLKEDYDDLCETFNLPIEQIKKMVASIEKDFKGDIELTYDDIEEIISDEIKVKKNNIKNVVHNVENKPNKSKKPRTVKISDEKHQLFSDLLDNLSKLYENVEVLNENKMILVKINDIEFKINITQTRKKK